MYKVLCTRICLIIISVCSLIELGEAQTNPEQPNILLIIADDMGIDMLEGFLEGGIKANTPHLNSLKERGITFTNAWATPQCSPTRATMMSGKYGVKTGVIEVPGTLDPIHSSLFKELKERTNNSYSGAVIGKWQLGNQNDLTHPAQHEVDHYDGRFSGTIRNYFNWDKVTNGVASSVNEYATTHLTNGAIDWINDQNQPWFLWLAHLAPHSPFHVPPSDLFTTPATSTLTQFIAMVEAMDSEIGRLLENIPPDVLDNTVILFIGDNGTPNNVLQNYPNRHGKSSLYQGGVHVPMMVAGAGVPRENEVESAMVHCVDFYATILELAGIDLPGGIHNSLSFKPLLTAPNENTRPYNYSGIEEDWTIRDAQYKLIQFANGTQEFYDLLADPLEVNNLINNLSADQTAILIKLENEGTQIRAGWSCQDAIQNGEETGIDCGGSICMGCDSTPAPTYCDSDSLIVTAEMTTDIAIYAEKYIETAYPLSGNNGIFQAGECVVLKPGFEYAGIGTLDINIASCLSDFFRVDSEQEIQMKTQALTFEKEEAVNNLKDWDLQIMPNPTKGEVLVFLNGVAGSNYQITVFNYQGKQIQQPIVNQLNSAGRITTNVSLRDDPTGVYFLRLIVDGTVLTRKIVKE